MAAKTNERKHSSERAREGRKAGARIGIQIAYVLDCSICRDFRHSTMLCRAGLFAGIAGQARFDHEISTFHWLRLCIG